LLSVLRLSKLLNTAEAATFLRVSDASIRRWSDAGLLPSRRVGGRRERRFTEPDLVQFLNRGSGQQATQSAINVGGVLVPTPGHLATFHSTDAGALRLTLPFLADGMRSGEPSFLVAADGVLQRYEEALAQQEGVDLGAAMDGGGFTVVHLQGTAEDAIALWERLFAHALSTGATKLRIVGEMASERAMFPSEDEMLRYEEAFEVMFKRYPGVVLCQYDVRAFGGSSILRALKAHPDLYTLRLGTFLN
jgi:excisionase family DNA binding protein